MTSLYSLAHLRDLPALSWDALVPAGQPFLSHAFLSALEDSGSVSRQTGWAAEHLVLERDGEVRALLPAYRKWHSFGEYVFDHGWADACERAGIAYYPKLLGAVPFSPVSGPRLLSADPADALLLLQALPEYLVKGELSGAHINFTDSSLDEQMLAQPGWMERLGCQFHWRNRGYRDFQDFLDTLSSRKRKQMRKEREQVAGQGIDFQWLRGDELDQARWDFVYRCYANTYAVRRRAPYLTREFFSLLAERMPEALRVVVARQNGRDVAMALSLVGGDSFYGRYWGCLDEFDRLHFETCFYQGMDYAIAEGLQRFDAGAQGEHKLIRGFEPVLTRSWHYLRHPGLRRAVDEFLAQERDGVRAYTEQAREMLPYRRG
ncbi:GNAT family N-acetyltransferase [Pseudomonas putida]|uniref:GNAT family N-acetyltransferase n=1 Tax=Pseudomonas putida TaxID=303 RepID=UPI0008196837|nr:GNAT family N-acetyltransferase [Pseudomonas putida]OCT24960.1 acyltransferase superfamily protein [Pseudomonas putida]OCT28948.1 acyltransferase superfamily protein [Pseudomonas putida]OCT35065.1 acyltransferase superfamily protein [Pseudomonas putida]OCT39296.1 acyltransferase superfamily protein [Pseudomonas putida]